MNKIGGSMEMLSTMQLTKDMAGLDVQSKMILHNKEVLAIILQDTVEEYEGYSRKEIMEFIEGASISEATEVSQGRTNSQVKGDSAEFAQLNEKVSYFDLLFCAKNPKLSTEKVLVNIRVDIESQKAYYPGYPIEMRGIYYLARQLSAQLSLITEQTDYGSLEKCYGIWICRDDIPKEDRYSISFYGIKNTKNIGINKVPGENYDLMTLVIIRLGDKVYDGEKGDECYELLRFLNTIMYPHKADFMKTISEYIDFSGNEELWKEAEQVRGLGQCIADEIREEIRDEVREEVKDEVREEVKDEIREEVKDEVREEVKDEVREEVKDEVREEVKDEVREEVKDEVREEVKDEVREEVREEGIRVLILDNLEEEIPRERSIIKLQRRFQLTEDQAVAYYDKFAARP
ncbi:MAG: hypothetical protein HFH87_01035 [Lachnospiraceae bacterium]|nr:hypothetical protein [Lachnospiraceae bacterium]